jgi:ABC-2 type transport system permease protein
MFINNFVFLLFWSILFSNKGGSINGVGMADIMYLWSIPTIGYGIVFFCFGGVETLCKDIVDGNMDIYLTKPKNGLISQLTSRSVLSAMGDLIFGAVIGFIAVSGNIFKFIWLLILALISAVILLSVIVIVRLFAFWLGDITNACHKYTHSLLITLTIYPEAMFPGFMKIIMYTAIPAMYVAHIPIRLMNNFSFVGLGILILAAIIFPIIMNVMYNKGLKKYESGNGVTRR